MPKRSAPPPSAVRTLDAVGIDRIEQYDGKEQVTELSVIVEVPGSWFGAGAEGALTDGERRSTTDRHTLHGWWNMRPCSSFRGQEVGL